MVFFFSPQATVNLLYCVPFQGLFSFVLIAVWTYFDLDILAWLLRVLAVIPHATLFSRSALKVLRVSTEII